MTGFAVSQPGTQANDAWSAVDSIRCTTKAELKLPDLSVMLVQATACDFHASLFEPSDYLQIGYLFESESDAEDRSIRFANGHGVSHYSPLGSLFIIPPHTAFETRCGPISNTGIFCHLDPSRDGAIMDQEIWRQASLLEVATNIRSPEMKRVMGEIVRELGHASRERALAIECLVSLALVHLCRYIGEYPSCRGVLPAWRVKRIEEMVREHIGQPLQVSEIAQSCGISNSHLMRAYKRTTGRTIGQLIEEIRIERAKAMLREGGFSITAIAEQLSYSSRPHFAAAFRRAEGVSPLSYRQISAKPLRAAGTGASH